MNVAADIEMIRRSAETIDPSKPDTIGPASQGDVVRQGDLYLVCLGEAPMPEGQPTSERQLVPGTTQGCRHIATGECTIITASNRERVAAEINRLVDQADVPVELLGPVIRCHGAVTITHPEHCHIVLPDGSVWAVVYQRAYADDVRRIVD